MSELSTSVSQITGPDRSVIKHMHSMWMALLFLPVTMGASADGKKLKSFMSSVTGLSPAHISTQGLRTKNQSTVQGLRLRQERELTLNLARAGLAEAEAKALIEQLPLTLLAAYVATISGHPKIRLPVASAFAGLLDHCCVEAGNCLEIGDFDGYKNQLTECASHLDEALCPGDSDGHQRLQAVIDEIQSAGDWPDLMGATKALINDSYIALLCAIDVEWGATYFPDMKPTPTFHWLFPRFHPDLDPTNSKKLKRNLVIHPTRKLLECCWAVAKHACGTQARWPKNGPKPHDIALDIGLEPRNNVRLRKIMSGTAPATADEVVQYWEGLCEYLGVKSAGGKVLAPQPWIILALWMEQTFIQHNRADKSTTVFVPSWESYAALWTRMRSCWSDRLPRPGTGSWPRWMTDQPSRPDWAPSSQSSGLSSSPRDCQ